MILAAQAIAIDAADIEHVLVDRVVAIGGGMAAHRFLGDLALGQRLRSLSRCR